MKKIKNYFRFGILLFGISLLIWNCQNDELISSNKIQTEESKYKVSKITFEEIQQKENLNSIIKKFENRLDFNKKNTSNKNITSNDKSFTILTDEIYTVVSDSTETYTFRIETPTLSSSSFENFIIKKTGDNNFVFQIYRFKRIINTKNIKFPYTLSIQVVDSNQINIGDFNNQLSNKVYYDSESGCYFDIEYYHDWLLATLIFCPEAGGGSSTGDSGSGSNTSGGSDTSGGETWDTTGEGLSGGGSSGSGSSSGNGSSSTVVIIESPEAKMLDTFFENLTPKQDSCLSSQGIEMHNVIKTFLLDNFESNPIIVSQKNSVSSKLPTSTYTFDDAQNFAKLVLDNCGADVDWVNKIIDNLTNPCAKDIFEELQNNLYTENPLKPEIQIPNETINLNFSDSILKIFNDSNIFNYSISNDTLSPNSNGGTVGASTTISNAYLAKATQLSIARTMIHELVHAYLNVKYSNPFSFENGMDFRLKMEEYAKENGYNPNGTAEEQNIFQHDFMGQYVNAMAYSLYIWDKNYGTGGNLGWDYYYAMGFGGLFYVDKDINGNPIQMETESFKELIPSQTERDKIKKILFNEQEGNTNSKGTKCN